MIPTKSLPAISFKHFSKGLIHPMDVESLDLGQDCFADGINVDINDPMGAVTRAPGYAPSELTFPTVIGYSLKYFARWSIDVPSSQELLLLYYKSDSGSDYKMFFDPSGIWVELTEKEEITATSISEESDRTDFLFSSDKPSGYYTGWLVKGTASYAFVYDDDESGGIHTLKLAGLFGGWSPGIFTLYRSPLVAYYESSISDIEFSNFLTLNGKLRIGTGIGTNAVAQWIGYISNNLNPAGTLIPIAEFNLFPLNKFDYAEFVINYSGTSYSPIRVAFVAVDTEGQEFLLNQGTVAALNSGDVTGSELQFEFSRLDRRVTEVRLYANDDIGSSLLYLQIPVIAREYVSGGDVKWTFDFTYSASGRVFYHNYNLSAEVKFKSIEYHKGRVYIALGSDYVRFTQFNTTGAEIHDYFPYEESSGYGYFIVSAGEADKVTALGISRDNNLLIGKDNSLFSYKIQSSNSLIKTLDSVFSTLGVISQNAMDTTDVGVFIANQRGVFLYIGGINPPTRIMAGKIEKYYQSLLSIYKDNIKIKYNSKRDELWVLLQIVGDFGSVVTSDYRIFVYSLLNDNWRFFQPFHLVSWIDDTGLDENIEIIANNKVQRWQYGVSVYTHDGENPPEPFLITHNISPDLTLYEQIEEVYAEYNCSSPFTLRPVFNGMSNPFIEPNKKTFSIDKHKDFFGINIGQMVYKFKFVVKFGVTPLLQQINEFGLTLLPLGGEHVARKGR